MLWEKRKESTSVSEEKAYADALDAAFRPPRQPLRKRLQLRFSRRARRMMICAGALCLLFVLFMAFWNIRPTRRTEHYLALTVTDVTFDSLYGIDGACNCWRVNLGNSGMTASEVKTGDQIWVFYNGNGKQIQKIHQDFTYTREITARKICIGGATMPPERYLSYGLSQYDSLYFDIDGDGRLENCRLFAGMTSGFQTYWIVAFDLLGQPKLNTLFYVSGADTNPIFYIQNGNLQILYLSTDDGNAAAWDVRCTDGYIAVYADGEKLNSRVDLGNIVEPTYLENGVCFRLENTSEETTLSLELTDEESSQLMQSLMWQDWEEGTLTANFFSVTVWADNIEYTFGLTTEGMLTFENYHAVCPEALLKNLMNLVNREEKIAEEVRMHWENVYFYLEPEDHSVAYVYGSRILAEGYYCQIGDFLLVHLNGNYGIIQVFEKYGDDWRYNAANSAWEFIDIPDGQIFTTFEISFGYIPNPTEDYA